MAFLSLRAILSLSLALLLATPAVSHGNPDKPNVRGLLEPTKHNPTSKMIDPDAEVDHQPHFPAGDKCSTPGCGKRSQERAVGSAGWTPFTPLDRNFKWRAGVCGDPFGDPEHMRGGKYYNGGKIVATYKQGSKIAITFSVRAHHNGFLEFHVCDIAKCGGEISERCFRDGHCKQLQRSRNPNCDSGYSKNCAPIDSSYPGRWYLPCTRYPGSDGNLETFGLNNEILYDLPENLNCPHCVLHSFWSSANGCNPRGVIAYFDGPDGPKNWGQCYGQAGARGGVARNQRDCGRGSDGELRLAEEYYYCADIAIEPSSGRTESRPNPEEDQSEPEKEEPTATPSRSPMPVAATDDNVSSSSPEYSMEASPEVSSEPEATTAPVVGDRDGVVPSRSGLIADIVFYADGEAIRSVRDGDEIDVSAYDGFTFEAMTTRKVNKVTFYINNKYVKTERSEPYFMNGNYRNKINYWRNPILNEEFMLVTKAEDSVDEVTIKLIDGSA